MMQPQAQQLPLHLGPPRCHAYSRRVWRDDRWRSYCPDCGQYAPAAEEAEGGDSTIGSQDPRQAGHRHGPTQSGGY